MAVPNQTQAHDDVITKEKFDTMTLILIQKFKDNQSLLSTLNSSIPDSDFSTSIIESIEKIEKKFGSQDPLSVGDSLVKIGTIFLTSLNKPFGDIFGTFLVTIGLKIEELTNAENRDFVTRHDVVVAIEKAHAEIIEKSKTLDAATLITNYFDKVVDSFLECNLHDESLQKTFQKARDIMKDYVEKENTAERMAIFLIFDAFFEGLNSEKSI